MIAVRATIQARLDPQSQHLLSALIRELGWSPSRVVREGLRMLGASRLRRRRKGIIGLGQFASGISDLSTNKKYLQDFGR